MRKAGGCVGALRRHRLRPKTAAVLARFSQQRQLRASRIAELVDETGRIVAGEAMVGELRLSRIAAVIAHGAIDSVDGEEGERVGADKPAHLLEGHAGSE